jgi:outer membrane protein assembly factor BamB
MAKKLLLTALMIFAVLPCYVQTISQWRGTERNGIYHETGLLKTWPAEGPGLLWKIDSIGNGFASPTVTRDRIFIPGEIDSTGYLFAFDKQGHMIWKQPTGREWTENFPGPRSTPTVVDGLVYYCSSMGEILCLEASSGHKKWAVNMLGDLHGINTRFGYTESLLVDEDRVYCFPGGRDTNAVALDRFSGKLIWTSKAMGDTSAYCSPVIIKTGGRKVVVTMVIHHTIGLDAATGQLLWSVKHERAGDIHCNTPIFDNGGIYCDDRGGNGIVKLELSTDGTVGETGRLLLWIKIQARTI